MAYMADMHSGVREIIEALRRKYARGPKLASLREIGRIFGVSHQTLTNWTKAPKEHIQLFGFIEKARKELGLSESTVYKRTIKAALRTKREKIVD